MINGWWQNSHGKDNRKGKENGFEALNTLVMLGIVVLNVVHVMHE